MHKLKALIFYYIIRPWMNRFQEENFVKCPCCREVLQKYDDCGFIHMCDGDADCYGALGKGKGGFK